jgi:HEPN domain
MRWNQGRAVIERMLAAHELQRVPASRDHADRLMTEARNLLSAAEAVEDQSPEGAYGMLYDAARKALTAVLENQGLRPTQSGGHLATYDATIAQLDPPMGATMRPFNRMRAQRHDMQYPGEEDPPINAADVRRDFPKAAEILDLAERVLDQMDVF